MPSIGIVQQYNRYVKGIWDYSIYFKPPRVIYNPFNIILGYNDGHK